VSNTGWIRRTTERVDVSRVAVVETEVVVDVDTGYIAHEALRTLDGPLWLPLLALPRKVGPSRRSRAAESAATARCPAKLPPWTRPGRLPEGSRPGAVRISARSRPE
jgi:hypothetical protein